VGVGEGTIRLKGGGDQHCRWGRCIVGGAKWEKRGNKGNMKRSYGGRDRQ